MSAVSNKMDVGMRFAKYLQHESVGSRTKLINLLGPIFKEFLSKHKGRFFTGTACKELCDSVYQRAEQYAENKRNYERMKIYNAQMKAKRLAKEKLADSEKFVALKKTTDTKKSGTNARDVSKRNVHKKKFAFPRGQSKRSVPDRSASRCEVEKSEVAEEQKPARPSSGCRGSSRRGRLLSGYRGRQNNVDTEAMKSFRAKQAAEEEREKNRQHVLAMREQEARLGYLTPKTGPTPYDSPKIHPPEVLPSDSDSGDEYPSWWDD